MAFDPKQTETTKVYEYCDQPVLFLCRDNRGTDATLGQLYIALMIDETNESGTFFYLAVSPKRLELLETSQMELQEGFKKAEWGFVYGVLVLKSADYTGVIRIACEDLNPVDLPEPGTYLMNH